MRQKCVKTRSNFFLLKIFYSYPSFYLVSSNSYVFIAQISKFSSMRLMINLNHFNVRQIVDENFDKVISIVQSQRLKEYFAVRTLD